MVSSDIAPVAIVVEDERHIRRFVRTALETEKWRVFEAETMKQGLVEAGTRKPDVVILDLGLPDGDGVDFIRDLRTWSTTPVIVLSARVDETQKIAALDYRLLTTMIANVEKVLTHRQILRDVWGPSYVAQDHYVRVHMGSLRRKLEDDPAQPKHLLTETAVGYRLVP